MTKTYEKQVDTPITAMLAHVRGLYHERLKDVAIDVMLVSEIDDDSGEELRTLKLHGYPAAATIKIIPPAQRALGQGDALLTIDAVSWGALTEESRRALLDHELTHILVRGGRDDLNRPRLKLRLHDIEIGGFTDVLERHKAAALVALQVERHRLANGQYVWDFDGPLLKAVKVA